MPLKAPLKVAMTAATLAAMFATHASAQVQLTYAHSENPSAVEAAKAFKSIAEGRSGGEITVDLVLHGALGGDRDIVDQLRLGEVEYYVPGMHALAAVAPSTQLFDAPYLFSNRREFYALMSDPEVLGYVRDHVLEQTGNTVRVVGAAENSVRNLYSKDGPIRLPEDLGNTKLRVPPGPLNIQLWQALGVGSVVGLSGAERNQALQTGIIDAVEGSLSGARGAGHLDILEHVTMTGHQYSYMVHLMNNDFYESLSPSLQTVVDEAVYLSTIVQNGAAMREEQIALEQLADEGNTVTVLTPDELAQWQEIAFTVGQEFIDQEVDPDFRDTILAALEETREQFND